MLRTEPAVEMQQDCPYPLCVKNTFLDVLEPQTDHKAQALSCPAALLGDLDIAAAARAFTHGVVTREALEAAGHLKPVATCEQQEDEDRSSTAAGSSSAEATTESEWYAPTVCPDAPPAWSPRLPALPAPSPAPVAPSVPIFSTRPGVVPALTTAPLAWYRVAYLGGVGVRHGPHFQAPLTGVTLPRNEVFAVSQALSGADGRIYLKLADGRGWAFDDSALLPEDPSVVRGAWQQRADDSAAEAPEEKVHRRRRRKRGGVRRKPKGSRNPVQGEAAGEETPGEEEEEEEEEGEAE